jgi:hypothetical protein
MRVLSVLGVVIAGAAIGATAVLAPLLPRTSSTDQSGTGWMAGLATTASDASNAVSQTLTTTRSKSSRAISSDAPTDTANASKQANASPSTDADAAGSTDGPLVGAAAAKTAASEKADPSIDAVPSVGQPQARVAAGTVIATGRKQTSSKPVGDEARLTLVRDIQRELIRVGCYAGDADGQWGGASKRAIGSFTDRVNASLPVEEPDFILLTLLQGHKGQACGASCPAGQGMATQGASQGRCVPNAILAQSGKPSGERTRPVTPRDQVAKDQAVKTPSAQDKPNNDQQSAVSVATAWAATVKPEPTTTPPVDAKAADPKIAALAQTPPPSVTALAAKPLEQLAALPSAVVATPAEPKFAPAPLPGRMTIGGPGERSIAAGAPQLETSTANPETNGTVDGGKTFKFQQNAAQRVTGQQNAALDVKEAPSDPIGTSKSAASSSTDSSSNSNDGNAAPKSTTSVKPRVAVPKKVDKPESVRPVVTRAEPARIKPAPRSIVSEPSPAPKLARRPEPVVVHRPPVVARYVAPSYLQGPSYNTDSSSARSRRMVYELFQRPDR